MSYLEIVLTGYCIENNNKNLVDYFISEFKIAEKERFCSSNLFFGGCLAVVAAFNENLQSQIHEQQSQLNKYLVSAGANKDQEFVNRFKEQIEYQKKEGITNFRLETGRMLHLKKQEINAIDNAIRVAHLKCDAAHQQDTKQNKKEETPTTFNELFYNAEMVKPCIEVLRELDPPFIDPNYNYIGKLKGIICVWIDELQRQGIVKHYSDRKVFASLIPQKIKRFSIDESMFGKPQKKAEDNYRTDIKTKVSKIKLSHDSQNGGKGK